MKKTELAIQEYLTEEEVWKLSRLATSERNRLLVLTLFYSALRVAEVLKLIPKDFSFYYKTSSPRRNVISMLHYHKFVIS
jgi:integrase